MTKITMAMRMLLAMGVLQFGDLGTNLAPTGMTNYNPAIQKLNNRSKYIPAGKNKNIPEGNR